MEERTTYFIANREIRSQELSSLGEFRVDFIQPDETVQAVRDTISSLNNEGRRKPHSGNPAAQWRLRCKRAANIESELRKLGPLALLSSSSLLTSLINGNVTVPKRISSSKETLRNSPLYLQLSSEGRRRLTGAQYINYNKIEESIQNIGAMICLSVHDLANRELLEAFWKFKLKIVEYAFSSPTSVDEVTECLKALGKACQALFLRVKPPDIPLREIISENGRLLPFEGPLSFINELLNVRGFDRRKLTYNEARILAQIGNSPRGLSYPSTEQVKRSIEKTIELVTTKETPNPGAMSLYRKGLAAVRSTIGLRKSDRTHVSLVTSGTSEVSRSKGGRARILVISARRTTDLDVPDECTFVNMYDQFGEVIISEATWKLFKLNMKRNIYLRNPTLGDLLYVKPGDLTENLQRSLNENFTVPKELAKILNLTASKLIRSNGSYRPNCIEMYNTIAFQTRKTKFILERPLQVKADVSIESGLKARLITAPQAAFAHLSQLPANLLREYYSRDPFHRVGFEESDKLWEVLKQYSKQDD